MIDEVEIQQLISLYHEGGSTADYDQVLATFLPDGIWEVPALDVRSQGHADIRAAISGLVASIEYLVQINAPAVIVVDGDTATARSLVHESAKFRNRPGLMNVVGQYRDELQRTADGWRFARRTFTILGRHMAAEQR
jgi:ketosteroid isomerase-like protein